MQPTSCVCDSLLELASRGELEIIVSVRWTLIHRRVRWPTLQAGVVFFINMYGLSLFAT